MALPNSKRRLLCEGWIDEGHDGFVIPPTVAYCVQGNKVWFAEGKATTAGKNLCESEDFGGMTIVESIDQLELVERTGPNGSVTTMPKDGRWYVEGPGQRSDVVNANKRKYKRAIWERIIGDTKSKQQQAIAARGMTGHFEHPADGRTKGPDVALVTVSAKLNEDGVVWAKHELLDTPAGLILQELTRKNVRWGVSTRGNGSVDESGNVSESDYEMECWDAVMRPSTPGAYAYTPKKGGKTNEEAEAFPQRQSPVVTLVQEDVEAVDKVNLAEADFESVAAVTTRLLGMLATGAPQDTSEKSDVSKWLARKLTESLARSRDLLAESVVERSISAVTASQPTPSQTGEGEVVAGLQKRLAASVQESEALKGELKALSARLEVAEATRDNAWKMVESAEADLTKTQAALTLAKSITESAVSAKPVVVEPKLDLAPVVEALLIAAPDLNRFTAMLNEATTFPALHETVRELIAMRPAPPVQKTEPVTEAEASPAPRIARGMLPTPITEGAASFDRPKLDESAEKLPENHPARVAARVVSRALPR